MQIEGRAADDLEDVGGGGLLLQRFPQLVEQAGVLDGDDGLPGEIPDQLDLFLGERPDLLAAKGNHADELVVLEHRHVEHGPIAGELDAGDQEWIALEVGRNRLDVGDLDHLLGGGDTSKRRVGRWPQQPFARSRLDIGGQGVVRGDQAEAVSLAQIQIAEFCLADARGVFHHGAEHRRELAGRARDDAQHIRGRRLLLQCLAEIVGALTELLEQPRILDGDDRLGGEVLDQLDLLVGERPDLLTLDVDGADQLTFLEDRNGEDGPIAAEFDGGDDKWIVGDVGRHRPHIGDMAHLLRGRDPPQGRICRGADDWIARARLHKRRRCIVHCGETESVSFVEIQRSEFGLADARRVFQHGLEDRFQRAWRARDDPQHLRRRGLLLHRLGERLFQFGAGFACAAGGRSGRTTTANAGSALRPFASQGHLIGVATGPMPVVTAGDQVF